MAEAQRKKTLKDGQEAGELLLDIETRIGEIAIKAPRTAPEPMRTPKGNLIGTKRSKEPLKHERLGITERRMRQSEAIAKHPEVVEKVKAQARADQRFYLVCPGVYRMELTRKPSGETSHHTTSQDIGERGTPVTGAGIASFF